MKSRRGLAGAVLVAGLGTLAFIAMRAAPEEPDARQGRAAELLMTSPDPLREDIQASMDASDEVVQRLQNEGVTNVGAELRARMAAIPVTDADAGAFFETNRAVFGDRQLHQERSTVEQLVRIHRLRAELGVPDPANGLRYP
jgi:hypothetical protein